MKVWVMWANRQSESMGTNAVDSLLFWWRRRASEDRSRCFADSHCEVIYPPPPDGLAAVEAAWMIRSNHVRNPGRWRLRKGGPRESREDRELFFANGMRAEGYAYRYLVRPPGATGMGWFVITPLRAEQMSASESSGRTGKLCIDVPRLGPTAAGAPDDERGAGRILLSSCRSRARDSILASICNHFPDMSADTGVHAHCSSVACVGRT